MCGWEIECSSLLNDMQQNDNPPYSRLISSIRSIFRSCLLVFLLLCFTRILVTKPQVKNITVVSLGFDDGYTDQYITGAILAAHDMKAVYYVSSGLIGKPGYMTWQQLTELYADGNEIGGHALNHSFLTNLAGENLRAEICSDRANLIDHGLNPVSFAYPNGSYNDDTIQAVIYCGYDNARTVGGRMETLPPYNLYSTRILFTVKADTSPLDIENMILKSNHKGSYWLQLVLHHVCNGCSDYAISLEDFTKLLDWLQTRSAQGILVGTPNQIIIRPFQAVPATYMPQP